MSANQFDVHAGKRLREARRQREVTQCQLAKALGVSFQQVQKYEIGSNRISFSRLVDICVALNIPPTHFFADLDVLEPDWAHSVDEAEALVLYRQLPEAKRVVVRELLGKM